MDFIYLIYYAFRVLTHGGGGGGEEEEEERKKVFNLWAGMTGSAVWDTQVWHYTEHCDSFQKQTIHNNSVRCVVNNTSLIFKVRHI
jgi:hypothetical protein